MPEEAVGENKNVIQQMDKLKKRFGKIRDIHIDKQKKISTLTARKISALDRIVLVDLEETITERRTKLKTIKQDISVLSKTYDIDKAALAVEELKSKTVRESARFLFDSGCASLPDFCIGTRACFKRNATFRFWVRESARFLHRNTRVL